MEECIFCSIVKSGETLIWQNDTVAAFMDISPKAPWHALVVPKRHVQDLDSLDDPELAGQLLMAVREVAANNGVKGAYRVHINNGKAVGQVVGHLHLHVLGKLAQKQLDELRDNGM